MCMDPVFSVSASIANYLSVAFHQNEIALVNEIELQNDLGRDVAEIELRIESEPAFAAPLVIRIDGIANGSSRRISSVDLKLDAGFLRQLREGLLGSLVLAVWEGKEVLARLRSDIHLHPPSHWGGTGAAPELLAAFVRPNDPAIDVVLHDAASKLSASGKDAAIDGYKAGTKERSWELASAIWSAIARHGLTYVLPPSSFERSGQKVRSPSDLLERRTGTCLDTALMYAACLEQAGLNPLVVLTQGHAFVGLWLKQDDFSTVAVDDVQVLRKRRDLEDLILIETTLLTHSPPGSFSAAVKQASIQVEEGAATFEVAIDIRRARVRHIRPLDLGEGALSTLKPIDETNPVDLEIEAPPIFTGETASHTAKEEPIDRLEKWKRKLLDLSLRNKLLNFKDTRKGVLIECPEPARLEDMLAEGKNFKLMAHSDVLGVGDARNSELFRERHHEDGRESYLLQALERAELHTTSSQTELDNRLLDLFRLTRTAFEEGGSNILFLAMGFLKWTQKDKGPVYRAPLLLVPVSLQRSSVRSGFRLALHDEDVRFNPTLLQMLRQDFKLSIPELDGELPSDQSGIDVSKILRIVRTHVKDLRGWEVSPEVVLSTFSFTKFLMWRDLVERTELLKRNPVVRHLIDTPKEQYGDGTPFPAPDKIDQDYHPADIFAPLSADSSQLAAVLAASSGKDYVLFGPPGTGKSQTIANIISQCLALGKTVLFVSQKTAALEVVQRRLRDIGLGEYCLEVHSTKAQKSAVLGQLKQAWHERQSPAAADWIAAADGLAKLRNELNSLVSVLHRRRANGMTAFQALGRVAADRSRFVGTKFEWPSIEHTTQQIQAMREICRELKIDAAIVGDVASHSLRGMGTFAWDPFWPVKVEKTIKSSVGAIQDFEKKAKTLAAALGFAPSTDTEATRQLIAFGKLMSADAAGNGQLFLGEQAVTVKSAIVELGKLQAKLSKQRDQLTVVYRPSVFDQDLKQILSDWTDAKVANFLTRGGKERRVRALLQPYATANLPTEIGQDLVCLIEMKETAKAASDLVPRLSVFEGIDTNIDMELRSLGIFLDWAKQFTQLLPTTAAVVGLTTKQLQEDAIRMRVERREAFRSGGEVAIASAEAEQSLLAVEDAKSDLGCLVGLGPNASSLLDNSLEGLSIATLERWATGLGLAQTWSAWSNTADRAQTAGLSSLVVSIADGSIRPSEIEAAFEALYARWWSNFLVAEDPLLRTFLAARQEDAIARFRAADERVAELSKRIVRSRLAGTIPGPTAFGSDPEWGTLARELQKRAKHQPLRQLFGNIPTILTQLTPCVMMSPLSIAQYLPPDSKPFDVVIFDEASQIPVWDAIGAIARGNQVIIVGDPEQLPPTNVGERSVDEIEDGTDVEDQESILDECLASNIPAQRLDWHYRSRHESLIAFSNNAYYKGRLVTFPSPVTQDQAVRYVHVPNGIYERGTGRVNREEARVVVAELVSRLRDPYFVGQGLSIGVVTFNSEQMRLIENMLDQERRSYPEIERFFDAARSQEPVFVKNLENVQGDERDIIFFSVAVGPDQTGRTVSTVSSLNKEGGHRRLNVAITRARQEMVVFATLRPEQIDLSRTAARGVREFKHFLEFAERGTRAIAEAFSPTGQDTESPFEDAVKAALETRGWTVHPQVGVSNFRVDLGIVDPDAPGRYLAGVECDGATYHRSATARDRDRLREQILRGLGWRIHRVWSTDWWMNFEVATETLQSALEADLASSRASSTKAAEAAAKEAEKILLSQPQADAMVAEPAPDTDNAPESKLVRPDTQKMDDLAVEEIISASMNTALVVQGSPPNGSSAHVTSYADAVTVASQADPQAGAKRLYRQTNLLTAGFSSDASKFYDPAYRSQLRAMTTHILSVEAPIYEDLLFQRLARAHGFARAGGNIRETIQNAIGRIVQVVEDDGRRLIWPLGTDTTVIVPFRECISEERTHVDVPLCELASLALRFAKDGGDRDETVRRMAQHFELGRFRSVTQERFERAYRRAVGD